MNINKNKYFCDQCSKSRHGVITFCSFDKHRDYTNHLCIAKHIRNCELLEKDPDSIKCAHYNKLFSVEGYEVHKKRNERLWTIKKYTGNDFLTCNRFQWKEDGKLFSSMEQLIDFRNNPVVSNIASKKKTLKEKGLVNSFSYLKSNENKSIEEKEKIVEKEEEEWVDISQRPVLPMCNLCMGYENEDKEYAVSHLLKWDMNICDCIEED